MTRGPVDPRPDTTDESLVRQRWRDRDVEARIVIPDEATAPAYVIHRGPPSTKADDGAFSVAAHAIVDLVARYRAMCGTAVARIAGRDGDDPARDEAERSLSQGLGCLPDGEVYRTTDATYVDSVWWALAQLWDAGLLRETHDLAPWCPACAATVEDVVPAHLETTTTAAVVRFPLNGDNALRLVGASLLVEVTDPWMLPSVTAVRIDPAAAYVLAKAPDDDYPVVLARSAVTPLLGAQAAVHRDVAIDELLAARYRPVTGAGVTSARRDIVIDVTGTSVVTRTGLAPVAPGCNAADLRIAFDRDVEIVDPVGPDGQLAAAVRPDGDGDLAEVERAVIDELRVRGLVLSAEPRTRIADACSGCGGAIVGRARPTWLITTTRMRDRLGTERAGVEGLAATEDRAVGWATGDADWPATRERSHGVPAPLWRCDDCAHVIAIGSRAELSALAGLDVGGREPRLERLDGVTFDCRRCPDGVARRVPHVVDTQVVAAAAPFARFGFPAVPGSDTDVAHRCHADLVVDGSHRPGWWADAVSAMSILLWDANGFSAALCHGTMPGVVRDTAPATATTVAPHIRTHGADAVRWTALTEPTGWGADELDAARRFLRLLCQARHEHAAAADADGWRPFDVSTVDTVGTMDRWALAELSDTVAVVRQRLDDLDMIGAGRRIRRFVEDLTSWYLPHARRRRAAPDEPSPAQRAYAHATLHECLVTVAALLAPFAPFTADELYEQLVRAADPAAPDSVHLLRFPTVDPSARNEGLRAAMVAARAIVALGTRGRGEAGVDRDRTLPRAAVTASSCLHPYWDRIAPLIAAELMVARVEHVAGHALDRGNTASGPWHVVRDGDMTVALDLNAAAVRSERLARDVVRAVNDLRSRQALARDRQVMVRIDADPELAEAVETHRHTIAADVLATRIEIGPTEHGVTVPLGDVGVRMALREVVPG